MSALTLERPLPLEQRETVDPPGVLWGAMTDSLQDDTSDPETLLRDETTDERSARFERDALPFLDQL